MVPYKQPKCFARSRDIADRARLRVMTATGSVIGGADVGHRHRITDGYAGQTIERIDATVLRISGPEREHADGKDPPEETSSWPRSTTAAAQIP